MYKTSKLRFIWALQLICLLTYTQCRPQNLDVPLIKEGSATLTGQVRTEVKNRKVDLEIVVPNPISGEYTRYKTQTDSTGKFTVDIELEIATSFISFNTSVNPEKFLLFKITGGINRVDISYNSANVIESIGSAANIPINDAVHGLDVVNKMISHRSGKAPETLYNKSTDYFLNHAKTVLSDRLTILENDTLLSNPLKEILTKDFSLFLYKAHVFNYEGEMRRNYQNTNSSQTDKPNIQKINKTYFRFLKDFKLNDSHYLYALTFQEFQKAILQNETLGLPIIGDTDIPTWLAEVKTILADLVGFNNGQYYDILAANAYGRQLNETLRPLSEKQKKNIESYWKKGEIAKILFRKNKKVVELDKFKSSVVVNDVSSVASDKVIETILAKNKDKIVFIDLWATWCSPCLEAMQEFRSAKNEFHDKNVVFVYLTNGSSPRKLWEEKIKGIGSEHYYLTKSQWEYIMEHFGFDAIPSYLLYNKKGVLNNKFTGFPGNEKVKSIIDELLLNK
jgi:thiol-disulfide isomerase/thioredoxin